MPDTQLTEEEMDLMSRVESAVHATVAAEMEILKNGRVEKSLTTCFKDEISKLIQIEGIRVDTFYDKHLGATKRLNDRRIELDIAVHERNSDEHNLVAIELETINKPKEDDRWKLEGLTQQLGGYGYKLGLYVVFGISERAGEILIMDWYKDGNLLT